MNAFQSLFLLILYLMFLFAAVKMLIGVFRSIKSGYIVSSKIESNYATDVTYFREESPVLFWISVIWQTLLSLFIIFVIPVFALLSSH